MRLALHACCGPCLLEPYDILSTDAEKIAVVYANPNIHPLSEYEHRRDTLVEYAQAHGIETIELAYDPDVWLERAGVHGRNRDSRCGECYRLRLEQVAEWAVANGFDAISTTLTVSPYQNVDEIARAGREVAESRGLAYVHQDFRERYPEATKRSRELGMYRQNYCGCLMSDIEATEERAARKAARKAAKQAAEKA